MNESLKMNNGEPRYRLHDGKIEMILNGEEMTLIGGEEDWPEAYDCGFDAPMKVISDILLDSEACDLPISWPEVLSGWPNAGKLLKCLEGIHHSRNAYWLFDAVDGCLVNSFGGADCVWVQNKKLQQASDTIVTLSDALKSYWISSGKAAAAKQLYARKRTR
jgi:hypothetical protein